MSDIFAPLRDPEPLTAPPPEEVRRRGDRLRRRRTGFAVAAAACAVGAVVGGGAFVVERTTADPAPGPVEEPAVDAVIPPDLDLGEALPRNDTWVDSDPFAVKVCGRSVAVEHGAVDSRTVVFAAQGDFRRRHLSVFTDQVEARRAAGELVDALDGCPRHVDERGRVWTTDVRPTSRGDASWSVTRLRERRGSPEAPESLQVVLQGAALLVIHDREIHAGTDPKLVTRLTEDEADWVLERELCRLEDGGCPWSDDPDVLLSDGWGPFRLRMSRAELEEVGSAPVHAAGDCVTIDLGPGEGVLSESSGLVSIEMPDDVTTAEGIGVGSTKNEVQDAYAFAGEPRGDEHVVRASVPGDYVFTFEGHEVIRLVLVSRGNPCD